MPPSVRALYFSVVSPFLGHYFPVWTPWYSFFRPIVTGSASVFLLFFILFLRWRSRWFFSFFVTVPAYASSVSSLFGVFSFSRVGPLLFFGPALRLSRLFSLVVSFLSRSLFDRVLFFSLCPWFPRRLAVLPGCLLVCFTVFCIPLA